MALVCRNPFGGGGLCSLPARGEDADPPIAVCLSACLPHRNTNVSLGPSSRRQTRGKDRQRNNSHKYRAHECLSGPLTARKRHPYRSRDFCLCVGLAPFYILLCQVSFINCVVSVVLFAAACSYEQNEIGPARHDQEGRADHVRHREQDQLRRLPRYAGIL